MKTKTSPVQNSAPRLSKIKLCEWASQETPCFEAVLEYAGQKYRVSNSGRGGGNSYHPQPPLNELDVWAAANNAPIAEMGGFKIDPPLVVSFETWIFGKAFGA